MSQQGNIDKGANSFFKNNTSIIQKKEIDLNFDQKLRQIKQVVRHSISQDKFRQIENQLEVLHNIYKSDVTKEKGSKIKSQEQKQCFGTKQQAKRSEKVILEVLEGKKLENSFQIESQVSIIHSPERKVETKKFVKFQPKRSSNDNLTNLVGLIKNSPNN